MRPLQQDLINRWSLCLLAACLIFPLEKASLFVCYMHDLRAERFFKGHLNAFFFPTGEKNAQRGWMSYFKATQRFNESVWVESIAIVFSLPFFLFVHLQLRVHGIIVLLVAHRTVSKLVLLQGSVLSPTDLYAHKRLRW